MNEGAQLRKQSDERVSTREGIQIDESDPQPENAKGSIRKR
jgi:hypothetical protein